MFCRALGYDRVEPTGPRAYRRMFRSPRRLAGMPDTSETEWPRSPLIQFCISLAAAIVLAVLAAMLKDLRWLLFAVWPLAVAAQWEFMRLRKSDQIRGWTFYGSIISGAALVLFYLALSPENSGRREEKLPGFTAILVLNIEDAMIYGNKYVKYPT